jgi:hypothetical protein
VISPSVSQPIAIWGYDVAHERFLEVPLIKEVLDAPLAVLESLPPALDTVANRTRLLIHVVTHDRYPEWNR